ncbi:RNA recognition motif-containing protein [Agyrium rufum]|nr:RNA recognition motif-containing protein [Agyrium rufum]
MDDSIVSVTVTASSSALVPMEKTTDGAKPKADSRSLFVHSLAPTTTTESLTEYFSQSYPLKHATVVVDASTKESRGFGFVTFVDADDAQRARTEFNGKLLDGRKIKVDIAERRQREQASTQDGIVVDATNAQASRKRKRQDEQRPPKLIVRNLPWSIRTPEQLGALFRSYGKIKLARLPPTKPGLSSGFGFVVLRGRKNAEKALAEVNGKEIDGRTLAVDWAVDKEVWENLRKQEDDQNAGPMEHDSVKSEDEEADGLVDFEAIPHSDAENAGVSEDDSEGENRVQNALEDEDKYDESGDEDTKPSDTQSQDLTTTLFVRNLPFSCTDETLMEHFQAMGAVRYARVVEDPSTGRPRGTGFVCFFNPDEAMTCLREAPRPAPMPQDKSSKKGAAHPKNQSLLEDMQADKSGRFTLDGRILHVTRAVNRDEAHRLTTEGTTIRNKRDNDKRRFYLLSEGTIASNTPLYSLLGPTELRIREDSVKQRQNLMKGNPSLHLSLTRLSIRNIPRHVTSKDLKALARQAVVEFAKDVKDEKRRPLSKEELIRGGEEMKIAERNRKLKGKGIVTQAKVVFEGREGGKVTEDSGAGRSRGYGFVEYSSHRWALMGLRWLNGHPIAPPPPKNGQKKQPDDRKKRLVVEFAIENAQVVSRRQLRDSRPRNDGKPDLRRNPDTPNAGKREINEQPDRDQLSQGLKRKRSNSAGNPRGNLEVILADADDGEGPDAASKMAKRQRIIGKKRKMRKARKHT